MSCWRVRRLAIMIELLLAKCSWFSMIRRLYGRRTMENYMLYSWRHSSNKTFAALSSEKWLVSLFLSSSSSSPRSSLCTLSTSSSSSSSSSSQSSSSSSSSLDVSKLMPIWCLEEIWTRTMNVKEEDVFTFLDEA